MADRGGNGEIAVGAGSTCSLVEVERSYLRLGEDTYAYVEPQVLLPAGGGFLLAGQPSYTTRVDAEGRGAILDEARFFGVRWERGRAELVGMPPVMAVPEWARGRVLGEGRWGFLLELAGATEDPVAPESPGIRYAERTTQGWGPTESVTPPDSGRVQGIYAAAWDPEGEGAQAPAFVVPAARAHGGIDVLLFERRGGSWASSVVWEEWVDEVAFARRPAGGRLLAVTGLDPHRGPGVRVVRSMRLESGSAPGPAGSVVHQVGEPGDGMVDPTFARRGDRLDLGWVRIGADGTSALWVATDVEHGEAQGPVLVDAEASRFRVVSLGRDPIWLTLHPGGPLGDDRLQAARVDEAGVHPLGFVPYPFTGPFAALATDTNQLLLVGAEATFQPTSPFVRSLVLRLSIHCT